MASVDLSVINAAATRTGSNPIAEMSASAGPVSALALNNYENLVKAELANYPWKRATKIIELNRIDPDVHGAAPLPWAAAYELPDDLVEIRTVQIGGAAVSYAIHGDTVLCDASAADQVILMYLWRVPEASWPAWFREGMIRRCEAMLLRGIGERYREAEARDAAADTQFATAKNRDSQSQTPRDPAPSPTLQARSGISSVSAWR